MLGISVVTPLFQFDRKIQQRLRHLAAITRTRIRLLGLPEQRDCPAWLAQIFERAPFLQLGASDKENASMGLGLRSYLLGCLLLAMKIRKGCGSFGLRQVNAGIITRGRRQPAKCVHRWQAIFGFAM